MINLQSICDQLKLTPRTRIEFGAAHPFSQRLGPFIDAGFKCILVEANPRLYYCLTEGWNMGDFKETWPELPPKPYEHPGLKGARLSIINAAIVERPGPVTLYEANASSFVKGVLSPTVVNDGFRETLTTRSYTVPGMTIDQFDDGEIDILLADVEGSEWWCIKGLRSRPRVIVLELWGQRFTNAYFNDICGWMVTNNYSFVGRTETDAVFVRRG